ncbi:unnamed protein product [Rotaria sp. Silwood2]|nr:unnamed protein product [Rotaria sp. Silwood2]
MTSKLLTRVQLEFLLKNNDKSIKLKKAEQTDRGSSFLPAFSLILVNDIVQHFVLCNKCQSIITYKKATGTGGLKKHLASCEKNTPSNTTQSTDAYIDFIILDARPFEIASGIGFKQFLQVIYNSGKSSSNTQSIDISDYLPHPTTVSRKIDKIYEFRKKQLISWCKALDSYTVVVDMWTEKYSGIHFCGVTVRATDSDFYLHNFCLCCKPYTLENQTALNIRKFIDELLLEYGLSLNTNSFIITDNEPKMIAALRGANRVGCSDHYINKILEHSFTLSKSGCVEVVQTFDVVKSLVANFRRSHRQINLSRKLQTYSSTRFSGAYYMMNVFNLTYNELIDTFSGSNYNDFESIDQDLLSHICDFLRVFDDVIKTLNDETQPTLHKVIPLRMALNNHCAPKADDSLSIIKLKEFLKEEIKMKWPIQSEHLLSTLIHPRLRDFCGNQSLKDQAIQLLQSAVVSPNSSFNTNSSTCDSSESSSIDKSMTSTKSNILSLCFDKPRAAKPPPDEVQLWLQGDFDSEIIDDDILSFWRRKKKEFPTIASIAQKVLAIPASNTSVERLFSSTKIMIGDSRTRLGSEKIDKLMFLRKNLTPLKHMFDLKNGSTTIMSKIKPNDAYEEDTNDSCGISKKIKATEEDEYDLISDDYESEKENLEAEIVLSFILINLVVFLAFFLLVLIQI